jgi:hypothetical protein
VVDSVAISYVAEDSIRNRDLFAFEKDTSMYFTEKHIVALSQSSRKEVVLVSSGNEGIKRPFRLESDDGIFSLLLLCFVFFAWIYRGGFTFFRKNIRLLLSSRKDLYLFGETTSAEFWVNFVLAFQSILLISIVLFDAFLSIYENPVVHNSFYTIVLFSATIILFLVAKYLFYLFIGYVFDLKKKIGAWLRNYVVVLEMLGVVAFIPVLLLVYSQSFHTYLLVLFLVLFLISRLILFYRLITFFSQEHVNSLFLIAYLCSIEIVPYLLLYELLINLYKVDIINLL